MAAGTTRRLRRLGDRARRWSLAPQLLAQAQQAGEVVDVGLEVGDAHEGLGHRGQLGLLLGLALGHHPVVE